MTENIGADSCAGIRFDFFIRAPVQNRSSKHAPRECVHDSRLAARKGGVSKETTRDLRTCA
jgi:hypothetical protein